MVEQKNRKNRFQNLRTYRELARKAQRAGEWGKAQELWLRYNQQKYRLDEARVKRRRTANVTDVSSEPAITSDDYDQTLTQIDTILRFITDQTIDNSGTHCTESERYNVPNDWHDNLDNVRQGLQEGTLTDFNLSKIEADEQHYLQSGLEYALWEKTDKLRFLDLPKACLREYLASYPELSDERGDLLMI
jgi:hypothetical protein